MLKMRPNFVVLFYTLFLGALKNRAVCTNLSAWKGMNGHNHAPAGAPGTSRPRVRVRRINCAVNSDRTH